MNLSERKQKLRDEVSVLDNSLPVSLEKLKGFGFSENTWAWFKSLNDEPTFKDLPENVKFCSPKTIADEMEFFLDETSTSYSKSALGVEEPQNGKQISKEMIDLVLIPGQAFDSNGNRLGRGKGYYDRFLKGYKGVKVGVCSKNRFIDFPIPVDPIFDVSVDYILTEDFVYQPVHVEKAV